MRIAVVGGGLAGLVAAYDLARAGAEVVLLEASDRLGGQVWTVREDGFVVERGAEGFPPPDRQFQKLLRELSLHDRVVGQLTTHTLARRGARLERLEPGEAATLIGLNVSPSDRGRGLVSFPRGMGEMINAITQTCTDQLTSHTGELVVELHPGGGAWSVVTRNRNEYAADGVVLAVATKGALEMLGPLVTKDLLQPLADQPLVSSVTVAVAFPRSRVRHQLDASGFVCPGDAQAEGLRAVTFVTSKFPGRAPAGWVQLRAFYRPGNSCPFEASDEEWIRWMRRDTDPILGLSGSPGRAWVSRWPGALPRHREPPATWAPALAARLSALGPIALAGSAFAGAGVARALRSGRAAAGRLLATIGVTSPRASGSL